LSCRAQNCHIHPIGAAIHVPLDLPAPGSSQAHGEPAAWRALGVDEARHLWWNTGEKEQIMKTRDEREAELVSLIQTQTGRDQIQVLYAKAVRLGAGKLPPVGISWQGDMIPAILKKEYPQYPQKP